MKKPELVIFDVDGLMLDTEAVWQKAWQLVGEAYGIENLGHTTFLKVVGRNGKEVEAIIEQELSFLPDPCAVLDKARKKGATLLQGQINVKPGLFELLDLLDYHQIKKAVATVTMKNVTEERLEKLGLLHRFDHIVCGDQVTHRKPDPEIYLKVLSELQVKPEQALVLEDSHVGVLAAYRANIPCIMVPDIVEATQVQYEQTEYIAKSLSEVSAFLMKDL